LVINNPGRFAQAGQIQLDPDLNNISYISIVTPEEFACSCA
jgi:hypothetical protein